MIALHYINPYPFQLQNTLLRLPQCLGNVLSCPFNKYLSSNANWQSPWKADAKQARLFLLEACTTALNPRAKRHPPRDSKGYQSWLCQTPRCVLRQSPNLPESRIPLPLNGFSKAYFFRLWRLNFTSAYNGTVWEKYVTCLFSPRQQLQKALERWIGTEFWTFCSGKILEAAWSGGKNVLRSCFFFFVLLRFLAEDKVWKTIVCGKAI